MSDSDASLRPCPLISILGRNAVDVVGAVSLSADSSLAQHGQGQGNLGLSLALPACRLV